MENIVALAEEQKGLDLVQALAECKDLLLHWGGHPVGVGLSIINEANVEEFTKRFLRAVKNQLGDEPQDSIHGNRRFY